MLPPSRPQDLGIDLGHLPRHKGRGRWKGSTAEARRWTTVCNPKFVNGGPSCLEWIAFQSFWVFGGVQRKRHGGEGTAARCSQVAKVHGELLVSSLAPVTAPTLFPAKTAPKGRRESVASMDGRRPQSSRRNNCNELTTASSLHRDTPRVCPAQKAVSAGKTGSSLAQNPRGFLIHTRSFNVTGWGHVLLKQRLGLVVVDIHWPAKPRSLGGSEQFFLHSFSRNMETRESLRCGFHGQAHAVQSSSNHHQTGSAATLQGTRHTRHCYRPARMTALSSIQDPARLPPSAFRLPDELHTKS